MINGEYEVNCTHKFITIGKLKELVANFTDEQTIGCNAVKNFVITDTKGVKAIAWIDTICEGTLEEFEE